VLVPAGEPVDAVIRSLVPHLQAGDVIIGSGNGFGILMIAQCGSGMTIEGNSDFLRIHQA
jgi:6-phosphogluconate dehydrogenase (decarboxylating)